MNSAEAIAVPAAGAVRGRATPARVRTTEATEIRPPPRPEKRAPKRRVPAGFSRGDAFFAEKYGITFTLTAEQDLVVSSVTFSFVGSFNGGSFDNAASSVSTDSTIKLSSDDSELASTTADIEATALNEGVTPGSLPGGNVVELSFDPITVSAGESISFTLDVTQNKLNTGLKSIAFSTSAVPEPSAFGLLAGLGALALVASRRRRK